MTNHNTDPFHGLLADTWWFGLTSRLDEARFDELARLRAAQGFNAVQLVVGLPPEVGPLNPNGRSDAGFPWSLDGAINADYLALARERIGRLNALGLRAVVYGAWGHQIAWLGRAGMARWWSRVVEAVGDLDVAFCLTGEMNLWIGAEGGLLPDRTSATLAGPRLLRWLPGRLHGVARRVHSRLERRRSPGLTAARHADWEHVLERLAALTDRPLVVHMLPGQTADNLLGNSHLLAANTIQTGHSEAQRDNLWRIPLREKQAHPERPFVNLEPWYEGILGQFKAADQLYAYWASLLAGASGFCYGAHGIWNVGDGRFLAQWGEQTFGQAMALDTPRLIGASHRLWFSTGLAGRAGAESIHEATREGRLVMIGRRAGDSEARFYPDASQAAGAPPGRLWSPMAGAFIEAMPSKGMVVVVRMATD